MKSSPTRIFKAYSNIPSRISQAQSDTSKQFQRREEFSTFWLLLPNDYDWNFPTRANLYIKILEQLDLCKSLGKGHQSIACSGLVRSTTKIGCQQDASRFIGDSEKMRVMKKGFMESLLAGDNWS